MRSYVLGAPYIRRIVTPRERTAPPRVARQASGGSQVFREDARADLQGGSSVGAAVRRQGYHPTRALMIC
jgi:hypothetical protein